MLKNLCTNQTFLTIISGVFVFILSQFLYEKYIQPFKKYNKLKGRTSYMLTLYAHYYSNPYNLLNKQEGNKLKEKYYIASDEMRKLGAELDGFINEIPKFYIGIPKKEKLKQAVRGIMGISNSFFTNSEDVLIRDSSKYVETIMKNLKLYR